MIPEWLHNSFHALGTIITGILLYLLRKKEININVNLNLKKPGIMKKLIQRAWSIPWIHALVMGLIGAIIGTIYPFANAWLQSQPVPSLKIILLTVLKAAVAFVLGYIGKHLVMGSSGPAVVLPPVPDAAPSGSPIPPGGSPIYQKGKSV